MQWQLKVKLLSDATFARGEAVPSVVDVEVEHDPTTGLPFIRGRVLKGLLVEACADILYSVGLANRGVLPALEQAAEYLFGIPGSVQENQGALHVGPALLPESLRRAVALAIETKKLRPHEVLESLMAIRRQTSADSSTGAPEEGSLRATRVVLRDTRFLADLDFTRPFRGNGQGKGAAGSSDGQGDQSAGCDDTDPVLSLLAACVKAVRRGGLARNRGRGRLELSLWLDGENVTDHCFERFEKIVKGEDNGSADVQD